MVRFHDDGGEDLAPVIPLFGDRAASRRAPSGDVHQPDDRAASIGSTASEVSDASTWHPTWQRDPESGPADPERAAADVDDRAAIELELAEKTLLKRLRMRSLSVKEARAVLAERDLDDDEIDAVVTAFVLRGYLDDGALAEQLIHAGVDRKGQGRGVLAQTLAKRGVPREVADAALAALPDDDAERALDFARTKARQLDSVDEQTALRRLMGQLARRGYPGSVASTAAREALREHRSGARGGGVRFV